MALSFYFNQNTGTYAGTHSHARAAEYSIIILHSSSDISGSGVKIDVAAIEEWPVNATALVHDGGALVCRTADPNESKEGAETSEIRIECERSQLIGTSCAVAPSCGQQNLYLYHTGVNAPHGLYEFNFNEDNINRLRCCISLTATQGGAAGEDGNEGKAGIRRGGGRGDGDGGAPCLCRERSFC